MNTFKYICVSEEQIAERKSRERNERDYDIAVAQELVSIGITN